MNDPHDPDSWPLSKLVDSLQFEDDYSSLIRECTDSAGEPLDGRTHLILAAIARSRSLIAGFLSLIEDRNRLCAMPLIRLQLDSAMRIHACRLVKSDDFVRHLLEGGLPNKYPNRGTTDLRDSALHASLTTVHSLASDAYADGSAYVHLSNQHLFAVFDQDELHRRIVRMGDLDTLPQWRDVDVKGALLAMAWVTHVMVEECKSLLRMPKTQILPVAGERHV